MRVQLQLDLKYSAGVESPFPWPGSPWSPQSFSLTMITIFAITMIASATSLVPLLNGATMYVNAKIARFIKDKRLAVSLLDNLEDTEDLAPCLLEDGVQVVIERMIHTNHILIGDVRVPITLGSEVENTVTAKRTATVEVGGVLIDTAMTTEKRHRRLPRSRAAKLEYTKLVIAEVKAKLGTPVDNAANRLVIRRVARGFMESHGLRPSHQQSRMDSIIEGVLTPGNEEIEAKRWGGSWAVRWRRTGGVPTWWSWATGLSDSG